MLEVILYPVQGRSVGEGSFNREVDICEWTFKKRKQHDDLQRLHHQPVCQIVKIQKPNLTLQPVLWEDEEGAAGWRRGLSGCTVVVELLES